MTESALHLQGVHYQMSGDTILQDVSFDLAPGTFAAIIGPNGSGKTSLIRAILGTLRGVQGDINVFGQIPATVPASWLGYVPQIKTLDRSFPAFAAELVLTGLRHRWPWRLSAQDKQAAEAALHRVGATHLADKPVAVLSGGELQRVYLARCIVRKPRLLLLDEPATGIDARTELDMYDVLDQFQSETKTTVVMITHDLAAARHHADKVLLLHHRVIAFGDPQDVMTDENMREVFGHLGHRHDMTVDGGGHLHD